MCEKDKNTLDLKSQNWRRCWFDWRNKYEYFG